MTEAELKGLNADIAANDLRIPIILFVDENGEERLLDGIQRLDAAQRAGIEVVKDGRFNYDRILHQYVRNIDPYRFVFSVNLHRRHLTNEKKLEVIGKLLELKPGTSDREIASWTGTSHPTVAKVRQEKEATGKISSSPIRIDKRGSKRGPKRLIGKPPKVAAAPIPTALAVIPAASTTPTISAALTVPTPSVASADAATRKETSSIFREIAKLAGECSALLTHAEQNKEAIRKRLSRIRELAGPKESHGQAITSPRLDCDAFAKALGLTTNVANKTGVTAGNGVMPPGADDLSIPANLRRLKVVS
jgi:ParB-like chromosome segregation protein Spo0J